MPKAKSRSEACVVAPTLRRARQALGMLRGRREGILEAATLTGFLKRVRACSMILCPEGKDLARDLAFLRKACERALWRAPSDDLRVAIAGLRGDHLSPLSARVRRPNSGERSLGLLLEGLVTATRARRALASDVRCWIVESPFRVRLSSVEFDRLAKARVSWFAMEPVRVRSLLASPELARARSQWRHFLPPRTRVIVIDS